MTTVDAKQFLEDQFPRPLWHILPTAIRSAYAAVDEMIRDQPILQVQSASDNKGRIIQWAVDRAVEKLVESGRLPFECRWRPYAKPTGMYLELRLSHSVVTISQVADPAKQPRNVAFRENGRLNNEPFFDIPEFEDDKQVKGLPHIFLTHGHQNLSFVHLAIPHPLHHRDFRFRTENLLHLAHEVPTTGPDVENTDVDFGATISLKQDIEKWRRDHE